MFKKRGNHHGQSKRIESSDFLAHEYESIVSELAPANKHLADLDECLLDRLCAYCRYLYEEEKSRTERLEKKANLYSIAQASVVFTILLAFPLERIPSSIRDTSSLFLMIASVFLLSSSIFIVSIMLTFFVYQVRVFERLTDPIVTVDHAAQMNKESSILAAMISDYTVATKVNYGINNKKSRYLSMALLAFILAVAGFALCLAILSYGVWQHAPASS